MRARLLSSGHARMLHLNHPCGTLLVFGLFEIFAAMKSKSIGFSAWGIGLFSGIVNIVCAIMLFVSPILFSLLVAVFVLWRGVAMIAEGVTVGKIVYR